MALPTLAVAITVTLAAGKEAGGRHSLMKLSAYKKQLELHAISSSANYQRQVANMSALQLIGWTFCQLNPG